MSEKVIIKCLHCKKNFIKEELGEEPMVIECECKNIKIEIKIKDEEEKKYELISIHSNE